MKRSTKVCKVCGEMPRKARPEEYNAIRDAALQEHKETTNPNVAWAKYVAIRDPAQAECDRICSLARAACDQIVGPAYLEYQKVCGPSLAEYEKICANAVRRLKVVRR